jgi:hypothetical protein
MKLFSPFGEGGGDDDDCNSMGEDTNMDSEEYAKCNNCVLWILRHSAIYQNKLKLIK